MLLRRFVDHLGVPPSTQSVVYSRLVTHLGVLVTPLLFAMSSYLHVEQRAVARGGGLG